MSSSVESTPSKQVSETSSPTITPLHDPAHQAKVQPHKPLGAVNPNPIVPGQNANSAFVPGLGQKALLAKKFAKANKPTVSPTDQMQSPCTQKLAGARQKHFIKAKPASLAASFTAVRESNSQSSGGGSNGRMDF